MSINLEKTKNHLLKQQKKVEEDIKALEEDDPVNQSDGLAESSEPGTDSWMADVHSRAMAARQSLLDLLDKTKKALNKIKTGKYGKCEKCGKMIEAERLEVMPTATFCMTCSKKSAR